MASHTHGPLRDASSSGLSILGLPGPKPFTSAPSTSATHWVYPRILLACASSSLSFLATVRASTPHSDSDPGLPLGPQALPFPKAGHLGHPSRRHPNPPSCASPTTWGKKAFTPRILLLATVLARAEHTTKHTGQPFRVMSFDIIRAFHAPGNRLTSRLGPLACSPRQVFHPPPPTAGDLYPTPSSSSALRRCPFLLLARRRGQGT